MALKVTTTIRNIHEVDRSDGLEDTYDKLVAAEEEGTEVTVDCLALDGYYDVTLADGTEVAALSWYHLEGFEEDGPVIE